MEFGTNVLSKIHSIFSDRIRFSKETFSSDILGIEVGKFIYKRPDNGKSIIEIKEMLMEVPSKDIVFFNERNYRSFQEEINGRFTLSISRLQEKLEKYKQEKQDFLEKTAVIEEMMRRIVEKNKEEYSENREKSLVQLQKNQRKNDRKVESYNENIEETKERLERLEESKIFSLTNVRIPKQKSVI